jgi:DNA-binding transcriptional regulator LsrR (DeoR family)
MVRGKPKNTKRMAKAERQKKASRMYLEGKTQYTIAEELNVNVSTICRDLAEVAKAWKEEAIKDISVLREMELKRLDELEEQASEMFDQTKEAKWLDIKLKAMERRTKFIGLDAAAESKIHMDAKVKNSGSVKIYLPEKD